MPLHLLGKKSWNVYNQDNVERVRRDEAAAEAREAAEDQAMQEADARQRMKILRGESPTEEPRVPDKRSASPKSKNVVNERLGLDTTYGERDRKRKRLRGEDDTDRDMRFAKRMVEDREDSNDKRLMRVSKIEDGTKLVDHAGHVNLFPVEAESIRKETARAVRDGEKKNYRKERELEQAPVMRLSEAGGRRTDRNPHPWYSRSRHHPLDDDHVELVRKDVWGNDDPNRESRDKTRINANDPLAAIKAGVKQVRKVEADRKRWQQERDADMRAVQREEKRRHRRREEPDELEDFRLDSSEPATGERRHHRHHDNKRSRNHGRSERDRGSSRKGHELDA